MQIRSTIIGRARASLFPQRQCRQGLEYLTFAGKQTNERSAFTELLQKGIGSVTALSESPQRDSREMELASTLDRLVVTKRFNAPETREAAERVRVLAEKGGNLAQLVLRVYDVWRSVMASGDYLTAGALADRTFDLARREGSPMSLAFAHQAELAVSSTAVTSLEPKSIHGAKWSP